MGNRYAAIFKNKTAAAAVTVEGVANTAGGFYEPSGRKGETDLSRRYNGVGRYRTSRSSSASQASNSVGNHAESLMLSSSRAETPLPQSITEIHSQRGYIGEHSLMSTFVSPSITPHIGSFPEGVHDQILKITAATSLPPASRIQAYADAYFKHLYHRAPVIDREDLQGTPSVLLLQAICLIGSLLRYPKDRDPISMSEPYYLKLKTLFYANNETDKLVVLKALCILCFWNMTPPVMVSLDSAWHWLGIAARLAFQMGFHRESNYAKLSNPGVVRRIMWFLFVSHICFGVLEHTDPCIG